MPPPRFGSPLLRPGPRAGRGQGAAEMGYMVSIYGLFRALAQRGNVALRFIDEDELTDAGLAGFRSAAAPPRAPHLINRIALHLTSSHRLSHRSSCLITLLIALLMTSHRGWPASGW